MRQLLRFALLSVMAMLAAMPSYAYSVSGRVIEKDSGEAEPFATYRIFNKKNMQKPQYIDATDVDGLFKQSVAAPGEYVLVVSFTGTKPTMLPFNITADTPDVALGDIALELSSDMLKEVTVVAQKPIVEADDDKLVYNAAEDASVQDKTVLEMLRKVPMVSVDAQDNITVKGQSDFKIYVNGRPDPMLSGNNRTDVLKAMPASFIKKIEVITEPGAKYDAEGVGGILNIITQSPSATSVNGETVTLTLGVRNDQLTGSVSAMARRGKVTASLSYGFGKQSPFYDQKQRSHQEREDFNSQSARYTITDMDAGIKGIFHYGNFQLSFEPDTLNLFTLSANGFLGDFKGEGPSKYSIFDADWNLTTSYDYNMDLRMKFSQLSATAAYQHTFRKPEHNLVASYQYSYGLHKQDIYNLYSNLQGDGELPPSLRSLSNTPSHEHTLQLDYTLPFGAGHSFETGAKGVFRRNRSIGDMYHMHDGEFVLQPDLSSTLKQYQDVAAAYVAASGKWRHWTLKGGLRFEHTHMGVNFITGKYDDFSANLNDWVPNAMLSYKISDMSNVRLSYQMRIRRPAANQLNPYREASMDGPGTVSYGNPDLTSERNNNITLTYSTFGRLFNANISATYSQSDNLIAQYSFLKDGILNQTYGNVGKRRNVDINGYFGITAIRNLSITLFASAQYINQKYPEMGLANHGWQGNFNLNFDWSLPWKLKFSGYGGMMTGFTDLQSSSTGWHYYGLSLSRSFLKDEPLRITLSCHDMFERHEVFKNKSWGDGWREESRSVMPSWGVGISVSYRFGKFNGGVKRTDKSIENDDVDRGNTTGLGTTKGN